MFKHDIWEQIKHITCFVLLFSESFYGQYMNIYMNWSRKVTWKWGPVMETGMSTSHVKLCAGGSPVKQDPLIPISPKSTNLRLPHFVSSELYTFSKVKYLLHQHSESNTERLELYHNSTAEETCSLYNCKQSTHQKLLQKSRQIKWNTLVTIKLWFLECFSPRS